MRIVHFDLRLSKQAGAYPPLFQRRAGKQVQAALYKIIIPECFVICQGLHPQIPHPQAAITLGAILKHILHTLPQGPAGHSIQVCLPGCAGIGPQRPIISRGGGNAEGILQRKLILTADIQHLDLQVPEGIPPGQLQHSRQHIDMYLLLLDPAHADPAAVILRIFRKLTFPFRKF